MNKRRYFITGGGTGGHIYPAIAVADGLLELDSTDEIFYIGNPNNLESTIVKDKPYKFLPVISSGMPRKLGLSLIKWLFQMLMAWLKCCYYISKYKPDMIFGTGGYVSAPSLIAGMTMNIPFVMHDCDANPGLVTRKLSPFAKSISIAFENAKKSLKNSDCRVNGNPIRETFLTLSKDEARVSLGLQDKLTLCVMGGSQGAKTINNATVKILEKLTREFDIQIIFQTGKKNFNEVVENLDQVYPNYKNNKNIIVKPYFDDMVSVLKSSDIAVSRAGSLSISELCASGIAPIFVPYPYAAADHQRKNAKCMVELGIGLYLEDSDTTPEALYNALSKLLNDQSMMAVMQQKALNEAKYDGVKNIIKQLL